MNTKRDIPILIKEYLNKIVEQISLERNLEWNIDYNFKFWLMEDDDELIEFLRSGLTIAVANLLADIEANAQIQYEEGEYENIITPLQRQELEKFPLGYGAILNIFSFFIYYRIHQATLIANWAEDTRMQDVITSFRVLGLNEIANGYSNGIKNIPTYDEENDLYGLFYVENCQTEIIGAFEKVIDFNIHQQQLDVAEAVRKNYQLFLV